ncbi:MULTISPECIES: CIA30 family protein [unclassified Halomonas]|uniref:CIA30 family protein n=1 Tax=unclassified Halomonas TaxID=2609666 RepID=UPI001CF4C8C4|nr:MULTISPECIES: CIA30 family protein [unclassified Halomonas]MCA8865514.1 CIA30 family protein [Halomonas sp. SBBP1]UZH10768.1 CIA30 family protein [Halomonas sp. BDJS001]
MALTFNSRNEQQRWYSVDDGVMGGVSRSGFCVTDGVGRFQGEVSLENGGGFASVRREPNGFEPTLADAQGIALTVRGDGRTYQLRLKSTALGDASAYRVKFAPDQDAWETLHFSWDAFEAVQRGTVLSDAPAITPSEIHQLGFLIADRTSGAFCLEVKHIEPLR